VSTVAGVLWFVHADATQEAQDEVASQTLLLAGTTLREHLRESDPRAQATDARASELDAVFRNLDEDLGVPLLVKLWNREGLLVYSSGHAQIGLMFAQEHDPKELEHVLEGEIEREVTHVRLDAPAGEEVKVLEAFVPVRLSQGKAAGAGAVPPVLADRARLAQLLDNLVSNAIKFTPVGGHIEVRAYAGADTAVLEVRDTGIGIAAEERERLFERFFRTKAAGEQAIQGTGLGLSITKAIAEAHGGSRYPVGVSTTQEVRRRPRTPMPDR
jgi:signal transduction histidine kinase